MFVFQYALLDSSNPRISSAKCYLVSHVIKPVELVQMWEQINVLLVGEAMPHQPDSFIKSTKILILLELVSLNALITWLKDMELVFVM